MTGSVWLDIAVVAVAVLAAMSGWRYGAIASALAFLGVLGGLAAGIELTPHLVGGVDDARGRLLLGILVIVLLAVCGEIIGVTIGRFARRFIQHHVVRLVDSAVGALFQAVAVLVTAWLLAVPVATNTQSTAAAAVRDSWVLSNVDALAPSWLRAVPGRLSALLDTSGLPDVLGPFARTPITDVDPPAAESVSAPGVVAASASVFEIRGRAPGCQRTLEGSGFVVAPQRVMTNAHVVAGTSSVSVMTRDGALPATVVLFDPTTDVAILDVPGLGAEALRFAPDSAHSGQESVVLGYPGGGPFTASPARVRDRIMLSGPDIYHSTTIKREVYTIRGKVRSGNSGGPLVATDGSVLGVVFGAAVDDPDTGFVLTADEVEAQAGSAEQWSQAVGTGSCVA
ncbi:MarP family serine protease [Tomitella cavernea]|uniref:Acid resistance serine protease MarP n=1 Tax=Tomitella cavernea TaxID=1387982 RepID=A0ABP9C995_9ACTN|nr:MarP family serine protease [Tomitella cavernea]